MRYSSLIRFIIGFILLLGFTQCKKTEKCDTCAAAQTAQECNDNGCYWIPRHVFQAAWSPNAGYVFDSGRCDCQPETNTPPPEDVKPISVTISDVNKIPLPISFSDAISDFIVNSNTEIYVSLDEYPKNMYGGIFRYNGSMWRNEEMGTVAKYAQTSDKYIVEMAEDSIRTLSPGGTLNFPHVIRNHTKQVTDIYIDKNDILWVATADTGLANYNFKNNTWIHYSRSDIGLESKTVNNVIGDNDGNLYLRLGNNKIVKFNGSVCTPYGNVTSGQITATLNGSLYGFDNYKIFRYNGSLLEFANETYTESNRITDLVIDKNGKIWIATQGGLYSGFGDKFYKYIGSDGTPLGGSIYNLAINNDFLYLYSEKGILSFKY